MNLRHYADATRTVLPHHLDPPGPPPRLNLDCLRVVQTLLDALQALLADRCGKGSPEANAPDRRELLAHAHRQALLSDDDLGHLLALVDHAESSLALSGRFVALAQAVADRITATGRELGVWGAHQGIEIDLGEPATRQPARKPPTPRAQRLQAYLAATALAASPDFHQSLMAMLGTAKRLHTWGMHAAAGRLLVLAFDTALRLQFRLTFQGRSPDQFAVPALLSKLRSAAVLSRQEHDLLVAAWKARQKPDDPTAWETLYRACRVAAASFAGVTDEQPLAGRVAP